MKNGIYKSNGCEIHYKDGEIHRNDGPAATYSDGRQEWWLNGQFHRVGGPAIIRADGHMEWWVNGQRHCDTGPALVYPDGSKKWYRNGLPHREDGPAVEFIDGTKQFWLDGQHINAGDFAIRTAKNLQMTLDAMSDQQLQQVATVVGKMLSLRQKQEVSPPWIIDIKSKNINHPKF